VDEPGFTKLTEARLAIAGLGLMGGSLALALRGHCRELIGVDADPAVQAAAAARGVVDTTASLAEATAAADVLVLAAPVRGILAQLAELRRWTPANPVTVLDLGSTKGEIVQAMAGLPARYDPLGGHPMCGKEVSGLAHADPALFQGKVFVLVPLERTSPGALALAHSLVAAIGARPWVLAPDRHDQLAAMASHLPYLAASALVGAAHHTDDGEIWQMASSGFRDTSRLAASDVTMMLDILLTNRSAILETLGGYRAELEALMGLLEAGDAEALRARLSAIQAERLQRFVSQ
jgi:prephenate dehydrogenase